eukprot:TRINITY_DN3357_c0_g1_i1.p1 TRINITY_DN3357_c0_g1~~TRINITY_DN3357_c0_g1_i1.p1  ORF type:complete len:213 (-),score=8.25 TRINITY_DN3357_c0_g1_i1:346-984(-)
MGFKAPCCGLFTCLCCIASPILCCIFSFIISLLVVVGIVVVALYFILDPKVPEVSLVNQSVQQFNSSLISASATNLYAVSGEFSLTFQFKNPNRLKLDYSNTTVLISYPTTYLLLSNFTIPGFNQPAHDTRNVTVSPSFLTPIPTNVSPSFLADYANGTVPLTMAAKVGGKIDIWGITSPKAGVTMTCDMELDVYTRVIRQSKCSISDPYVN